MKRTFLIGALTLAMLLLSAGSVAAGPQALPSAACNSGTATANAAGAQTQSGDETPHLHDFDGDTVYACYHFNITQPPPGPGDE